MSELQRAAVSLQASLARYHWFRAVGIGMVDSVEGLIVYVSRDSKQVRQQIPSSWEGFTVSHQTMSQPIPLVSSGSQEQHEPPTNHGGVHQEAASLPATLTEADVEQVALDWLRDVRWSCGVRAGHRA